MDPRVSFHGTNFGVQIGANHGSITNHIHPHDITEKLPIAEEAAYDSYANQHDDECLPGTRIEILDEIGKWARSSDGKCIFWLNGMAGTGKTTISRTVAKSFSGSKSVPLGASFFFKRGEADRGNAHKLFPTVVRQLAQTLPQLLPYLQQAVARDPQIRSKSMKEQFDKLLLEPLKYVEQSGLSMPNLLIVIDALDECEGDKDIRLILQLLPRLETEYLKLRFFLTSRPELAIRLGFQRLSSNEYRDLVLHEITKNVIEHDISLFLEHRISEIRFDRSLPSDWPGATRFRLLVTLSVPLFIFAATICRIFEDDHWHPETSLNEILEHQNDASSTELDGTYLPVLNRLLPKGQSQRQIARLVHEFQEVVGAIVMLESPLSVSSLSRLLDISEDLINLKLDLLHSVLSVPQDKTVPVRQFHLSFRDFLLDPETPEKTPFWINGRGTHLTLALKCLCFAQKLLYKNICHLPRDGVLRSEISQETISRYIPPQLQYACRYWAYHLIECNELEKLVSHVVIFMRSSFLYWVEAMSLRGFTSEVGGTINLLYTKYTADKACTDQQRSEICEILSDANRFLLNICQIVDEVPLQIYSSGLIFAPDSSLTRRLFEKHIPNWVTRLPQTESHWTAEMQSFEGHSIMVDFVFSPNGQLLASACIDRVIRLWDTTTGALQQVIEAAGRIESIAFKMDSKTLLCALEKGIFQTFDPASGFLIRTVEVESEDELIPSAFRAARLSNDGCFLAARSNDDTILVWETEGGTLCQILDNHSETLLSAEFSDDNRLLISHSRGGIVKIWNIDTGNLESQHNIDDLDDLDEKGDILGSITLSPSNRNLILGSRSLRLWDIQTDTLQKTYEGHRDPQDYIVAFAPDASTFATISQRSLVRLWDTANGVMQNFPVNSRMVTKLRFSPNGQFLAMVGLYEGTILLWNTQSSLSSTPVFPNSPNSVNAIAPHPTRQVIALASQDSVIRIWNVDSGTIGHSRQAHSYAVNCIEFSPDGRLLASGASDGTVLLWETDRFTVIHELKCGKHSVGCVAFSPDGRLLACRHRLGLRTWDTERGTLQHTVTWSIWHEPSRLDRHHFMSAAFSPDSQLLVTDSEDDILRVLNARTGDVETCLDPTPAPIPFKIESPHKKFSALISSDNKIRLWKTGSRKALGVLGDLEDISHLAFSFDDRMMAISFFNQQTIELWDTEKAIPQHFFEENSEAIIALAFSPNGSMIASGSIDRTVKVWSLATQSVLKVCQGHSGPVCCVNFSYDNSLLVSGSFDKSVLLWDVATGSRVQSLRGHLDWVFSVEISLCNRFLASISRDRKALLWCVDEPGGPMRVRPGGLAGSLSSQCPSPYEDYEDDLPRSARNIQWPAGGLNVSQFMFQRSPALSKRINVSISCVAFSSDGRLLASGSSDGTVRVWDLTTNTLKWELSKNPSEISFVVFSPDNNQLASSSEQHTILLWDAHTGRICQAWTTDRLVKCLKFSEDGTQLSTNRGTLNIRPRPPNPTTRAGMEIQIVEEQWISINGEKILWLPPKYRPRIVHVEDGLLGMVRETGEISFIEFSV